MENSLILENLRIPIAQSSQISVNGKVSSHEKVLLQGPSGCGKSTLLRCLAGLINSLSGRLFLGSKEITFLAPQDRAVGLVFQNPALFSHLSLLENLLFPLRFQKKFKDWSLDLRLQRARKYLERAALQGKENRNIETLSGGEKQRLSLIRALIWDPDYLLLDEPFSAVDKERKLELQTWINEILEERSIPTIIVSHEPEDALPLKARIVHWSHLLNL